MVNKWIEFVQQQLYPASCCLCGSRAEGLLDLCVDCRLDLPANHCCCQRCAAPLATSADSVGICGKCMCDPPPFRRCLAPFLYRPPIDSLISGLKFRGKLSHARLLGLLLADFIERDGAPMPELLIPVPLHRQRLTERGFNQALELARPVSRRLGVPLDFASCVRRQRTAPQMSLDKRRRLFNLKGAFALRREIALRHVVLLDDVVTTGATVSELAQLMLQHGVERVDVWALARTP